MPSGLSNLIISFLRTLAATIAGGVITWLVAKGLDLDSTLKAPLTEVLFALFSAGYYALARVLEQYLSHHAGWLLLVPSQPVYPAKTT
jgi:hypothetical protein